MVSAVVLAPFTLAVTYAGGWLFVALCTISAGIILWEWTALVSRRADARILAPGWAALIAAAVLIGFRLASEAWAAIAIGALFAACSSPFCRAPKARQLRPTERLKKRRIRRFGSPAG